MKSPRPMDSDLRKLQMKELEILHEFDRVCKQLDLNYFLFYGTLLGAVRHQGFIPWDDDIDVIMTRNEYELFIKHGPSLIGDKYFIQNMKSESNFNYVITKIRDSETTFLEEFHQDDEINHGVWIDVFILDNIPRFVNSWCTGIFVSLVSQLPLLQQKPLFPERYPTFSKTVQGLFSSLPIIPSSMREITSKLLSITTNDKSDFLLCSHTSIHPYLIFERHLFEELIMMRFEDDYFPVPKQYDRILSILYGDYMKLPEESMRCPQHKNVLIDLNNSYKKYFGIGKISDK